MPPHRNRHSAAAEICNLIIFKRRTGNHFEWKMKRGKPGIRNHPAPASPHCQPTPMKLSH